MPLSFIQISLFCSFFSYTTKSDRTKHRRNCDKIKKSKEKRKKKCDMASRRKFLLVFLTFICFSQLIILKFLFKSSFFEAFFNSNHSYYTHFIPNNDPSKNILLEKIYFTYSFLIANYDKSGISIHDKTFFKGRLPIEYRPNTYEIFNNELFCPIKHNYSKTKTQSFINTDKPPYQYPKPKVKQFMHDLYQLQFPKTCDMVNFFTPKSHKCSNNLQKFV